MSVTRRNPRHSVFGVPILLGVASLAGLVIGLLGDGALDLVAWIGLSFPVVAIGWAMAARRR